MLRLLALALFGAMVASPVAATIVTTNRVQSTDTLDSEGYKVSCGGAYDLCGYADAGNKPTIPRRFEMAFPFSEGLARVRIDGKFGYIDRTGKVIIAPRFDDANDYVNGSANVYVDGKVGLIDKAGAYRLEYEHSGRRI